MRYELAGALNFSGPAQLRVIDKPASSNTEKFIHVDGST